MIVSMKSMLQHAHENGYAVMAINCVNMEIMRAIIEAAQESRSPVIINVSPRQFKAHADLKMICAMYRAYAKDKTVPIALNLDHGNLYEDMTYAMQMGFTSVMFDGSTLPIDENIRCTKIVKSLADEYGCSVEAELGHVGNALMGDNADQDLYTKVEDAVRFVNETHVDCLAVAIGTAHGKYPKGVIPKLDFERLKALKQALNMPLVLHGGSGTAKEDIVKAVKCGINKINVCTDAYAVGRDAIAKTLQENPSIDLMDLAHAYETEMKKFIKDYMKMIGSTNRAYYGQKEMVSYD